MNLSQRKSDFIELGTLLSDLLDGKFEEYSENNSHYDTLIELKERINTTFHYNKWFTSESVASALTGVVYMLKEESLSTWLSNYSGINNSDNSQSVGIVMAGNIPLVGFHDLLSVLITGNRAICKFSSSDDRLWPIIIQLLEEINPIYKERIKVVSKLEGIDAVIATGSNNTSRYFDYYFKKYPHIIRKNRNALALLKGDESEDDLKRLAKDVFAYFGLGCRNVSKLYLPQSMDLNKVIAAFYDYKEIINHNKYANNYDYNKTVMLLNQDELLENGFMLFKESKEIASPLATMYYEYYTDYKTVVEDLQDKESEIQCIVGKDYIDFGKAQLPELWEYADGVDTIDFLLSLN